MKKTYYFSIIVVLVSCATFIFMASCRKYIDDTPVVKTPDELLCQSNITGGCFDQWQSIDDGYGLICMEPAGNYLRTLNYLTTLPSSVGGPGPLTTDSSRDSHSGTYAALLITGTFSPQGDPLIIPGLVGTDSLDIPNATIHLGKRFTARPDSLQGWYKYVPVGGDSAMVSVLLSKYNVAAQKRDTIGLLRQIYHNTVYNYTFIDLPITYYSAATPDTLTLLICSSAGINFVDLLACKGQVGSRMWIDEISFVMP